MAQQDNDGVLTQAIFDTFAAFKEACKKADEVDLHVYVHMEGSTYKEVFSGAMLEVSRTWSQ